MKSKQFITVPKLNSIYDMIISVPYGDRQRLLNGLNPVYYNSGVYGWNFDVYEIERKSPSHTRKIAIVTGYRNLPKKHRDRRITTYYETAARKVDLWHEYAGDCISMFRSLWINDVI